MPILNSFLGAQPPKPRMNKGFLNGGGGGLRCNLKTTKKPHSARLNECYGHAASVGFHCKTHTSPLVATHTKQELQGKTFAFRYKENRRIGENAYFDTC